MLELLHVHHLDCEEAFIFAVLGFVDVSVLSLADLLEKNVVFNDFVHRVKP